jgi:NAD+ synthase (glutamine-hydrolysing)
MKIAVCQTNPIIGDFDYNTTLVENAVDRAKRSGCHLIVFPELTLPGYPANDLLEKAAFINRNLTRLETLSSGIRGISVLCGYVARYTEKPGQTLINGVALIQDGKVVGQGGKRLLPSYDVYAETRYFEPSRKSLSFELCGKRLGVTICEDIWSAGDLSGVPQYDLDPVSELAASDIDILLNMSASPYSLNKGEFRLRVLQRLAKKHDIPVVYCNQVGGNDELLFDGSSMVVDRDGRLICFGRQFEPDFFIWDTEIRYEEIKDPWPPDEEALLKGLIMGTRDYAVKCGFKKVVVGLSGGLDSSLVAFIAREALGPANVIGVSIPSPFTSEISRNDARELAGNLGIRFEEIPMHELFEAYSRALSPIFKGLAQDHTEENIQARIRGNLLMALSNKFGALLLSTGNKSELAMGYCTLYGDMCGGLAVLSDVYKTLCYRLANHINEERELIPCRIISRPPSAELKPCQTDQDTLPPYDVLDDILEAALERNLGLDDIVAQGQDPAVVTDVLRRLALNEYKRRQAAPGLRVTVKALGYGRRYPVARGKGVF